MARNIKLVAEELMKPLAKDGYDVWNIEFVRQGRDRQLCVYVDKQGGIGLDDCEIISRYLSEKLDEEDFISEPYSLIVSSPGMDRQLLNDRHFECYRGVEVEVSLYKEFSGRKRFCALLGKKTDETLFVTPIDRVTLAPECDEIAIPAELISKVNLMVVI